MMCKLSSSRVFRCILCLILVLVLLISWSPIRAKAVGVDQFIGVAVDKVGLYAQAGAMSTGATVFAWVLLGLGIIVTAAQAIDLMNQYTEFSGELETSIFYYSDGTWSYGVDMSFVEKVREFIFHTGVVVEGVRYTGNYPDGFAEALAIARTCPYAFVSYNEAGDPAQMAWSDVPFIEKPSTSPYRYLYCGSDYNFHHYFCSTNQTKINNTGAYAERLVWVGTTSPPPMYSDYGELGTVAPLEIPMPEGYSEWHTNSRPAKKADSNEEVVVLPIPLNPSADPETQIGTLTQPDIWQGTIADPMPDMQPDPNPDPGTGVPSDIGKYQIDLKDFFPFCIPFDLYDFFSCLAADPVAPVIEWVIPLPGGDTYPLEIDLSAFDGVAQLLRRLQLLLFCVGLAFKTRDLIKG